MSQEPTLEVVHFALAERYEVLRKPCPTCEGKGTVLHGARDDDGRRIVAFKEVTRRGKVIQEPAGTFDGSPAVWEEWLCQPDFDEPGCCGRGWVPDCTTDKLLEQALNLCIPMGYVQFHWMPNGNVGSCIHGYSNSVFSEGTTPNEALSRALYAATGPVTAHSGGR